MPVRHAGALSAGLVIHVGPRLYRETPPASEMPYHKRAAKELKRLAEAEAARAAAASAAAASVDGRATTAGPVANGAEPATATADRAAVLAAVASIGNSTAAAQSHPAEPGASRAASAVQHGAGPDVPAVQPAPSANHGAL